MNRFLVLLLAAFGASRVQAAPVSFYTGICEASAAALLDDTHFVVASDETNKLRIYQRGSPDPVGNPVNLRSFLKAKKSDLEASARVGDRIYWISSHSKGKAEKEADDRSVFFATDIVPGLTLTPVGKPFRDLGKALAKSIGRERKELNIEGLAATDDGRLLIGLRNPLTTDGRAIIVPLENPAEVIEGEAKPMLGEPIYINLAGNGIRSIDRNGIGGHPFLIIAGPIERADDETDEKKEKKKKEFALYSWTGGPEDPERLKAGFDKKFTPEAMIVYPKLQLIQIISDNGRECSEDGPPDQRRFPSIDIRLQP